MTTFYNRSVAVGRMRFVAPNLRMQTIVANQCPVDGTMLTGVDLISFGVKRKQ
jgi:hypothetical protein